MVAMMVAVMPVVVMVPPVVMVVVPVMAARTHPRTVLHPAPAVPDRMADVADVLDEPALAGGRQSAGTRQGQGLRGSGRKQRADR